MDYKYEVFISYRRQDEWPRWVKEQFLPIFKTWLGSEVGNCKIFFDQTMRTGISWPRVQSKVVGNEEKRSQVIIESDVRAENDFILESKNPVIEEIINAIDHFQKKDF